MRRIPEMGADEPFAVSEPGTDHRRAHDGCIRAEDRIVRTNRLEGGERLLLERHVLKDGFDDEVCCFYTFAAQVRCEEYPAQAVLKLLYGDNAVLHKLPAVHSDAAGDILRGNIRHRDPIRWIGRQTKAMFLPIIPPPTIRILVISFISG